MAVEAWKQKTIEDAISASNARNKCSAWYFLMKNVAPDRTCYEKLLLIHILLHTGIDKSEWNFSDEELICRLGCSRAMLYALVKSCESDYLFRREGTPDRRKYILSIENLVETLTPDHQADFYSRLGWTRREIELRVRPSDTSGRLPHGQDVHQKDDSSTTWNSCPGGGQEIQEVDAPNKEQEQVEEQVEEQEQEHLKSARKNGKAKKADKTPSRRFAPPTVDEVRAYCLERGNKIDPETFVDSYASKGWKVGNSAMKDWKAAVRTWEKREHQFNGHGIVPKFANQSPIGAGQIYDPNATTDL